LNDFVNLVNKADGTVKDFNCVYCNKCFENSGIKTYKDILAGQIWHKILNV